LARFFSTFVVMNGLEQIIEKCLLLKGRMVLPHWGILSIHRTSASMNKRQGFIYPPSEEISFIEVPQLSQDQLSAELSQFIFSEPLDIQGLAEKITRYAEGKKEAGNWKLGRLGTLETQSGKIIWVSSPAADWSSLADLPDIRLPNPGTSEFSDSGKESVAASVPPETSESVDESKEEKSSSRSLYIVLILALILALSMIIGSLWFWGPLSNRPLTEVELPVQKERLNVNPEEVGSSIKRTSVQHSKQDSYSSFDLNHRKLAEESDKNEPLVGSKRETTSSPENSNNKDVASTNQMIDQCVIIVGAFSSTSNVQRMEALLSAEGHSVYQSSVGGLTRVGVHAPCAPPDILRELRTIRKEIEPGAWILNE